ncbi:glycosyltransferase family 2 protein [Natrononativus amylolyticus]|uniref:glycosyltransferase family 2 protein n=1 Tax=Natrononativus amylolyticus TaxID=2963434 RepID=UPI0020CC0DE3|nr:glycosyltransferase family 2 protein [Natrononativus amylolyticus]
MESFLEARVLRAAANGDRGAVAGTESERSVESNRSAGGTSLTTVGDRVGPGVDDLGPVVVGIPAYNEAASIGAVVQSADRYADLVAVVDDGSSDETAARARNAGAVVIEHGYNRGYGAALKSLFREAAARNAAHLVTLDGDGQHTAADVPTLVETQRETDAAIVIGSRFVDGASENMPAGRRLGVMIVNALTNASVGTARRSRRISDTQSGFRAYSRKAINSLAADDRIHGGMSASTDILYHAHRRKYAIAEARIAARYDVENPNTERPFAHGYSLVSHIVTSVQSAHPLLSLGLFGVVSLLLATAAGYWLTTAYLGTGSVSLGLAALTVLFGVSGFVACVGAIFLHTLNVSRTAYPS